MRRRRSRSKPLLSSQRKNNLKHKIAITLAALFLGASSSASTLEINATTASIQHFFSPGGGYENFLGSYYGGEPAPSVSGRFSNYDQITFTLSAPSGYKYSVIPAPQATSVAINVGLFYNYAYSGGPSAVLPTTVEFKDYSGPSYSNSIQARSFYGGEQFYIEGWLSWSGYGGAVPGFDFSSIVITADLREMTGKTSALINYDPSFGSAVGMLTYTPPNLTVDPGPMVILEAINPVSEPNSMLLVLLGVSAIFIAARRKIAGAA